MSENTRDGPGSDGSPAETEPETDGGAASERIVGDHDSADVDISEYRAVMNAIEQGDYTARVDPSESDDELEDLALVFNRMMDTVESQMTDVWSFAGEVNSIGSSVASGSVEIEAASERVGKNMSDISRRTNDQNDSIAGVSAEMDNFSATMEEIASSATEVAQTAKEATERGEEGRKAAEQAIDETNIVEDASDDIVEKVIDLNDQIDDIAEMTGVITDIAEQTNILALNANIEAARSSKDNKGFAVVANEIKALAGESKDAAKEIEEVIQESHQMAEEAVEEVRATSESISESSRTIEEALEALTDTVEYTERANHGIQEISQAVDKQAEANERMVTEIHEVSDLSNEIDNRADEVAAAAQRQTDSIVDVSQKATDLRDTVGEFESSLGTFAEHEWGERITQHCLEAGIDWRQFEGTTLSFGMAEHMFTDATEPLLKYFENLTGITVEYEVAPEEQLFGEIEQAQKTGSSRFDGFFLALWSGANYHYNGWVHDLNQFWEDASLTDKEWYHLEDYPENAIEAFTYGSGDLVALPFGLEIYGAVAYDKPTFQKLGLDEPRTFEELRHAARTIHESDEVDRVGIVSRGNDDTLTTSNWATMFKSFGGEWLDYRTKTATLNSPEGVESLEMYAELMGQYGPDDIGTYNWFKANEQYGKGVSGMVYHAPGAGGPITQEQKSRTKWVPPISHENRESIVNLWAWALGISRYSENPGAAWLFLQWATCRPMNLFLSTDQWGRGGYGHARSHWLFDQPEYEKRGQPDSWIRAHKEGMARVPANPPPAPIQIPQTMEMMDYAAKAMNEAVTGQRSAQDALDAAAPKMTEIAKKIPNEYL